MAEKDAETARTPRWVKVFGIIALILVVLVLVMLVTGRGGHGPGRHTPLGDNAPSVDTGGHRLLTGAQAYP